MTPSIAPNRPVRKESFKEGEEKGIEKGIKEIVLFMYNKGFDPKQISDSTGIAEEKVTQIIQNC